MNATLHFQRGPLIALLAVPIWATDPLEPPPAGMCRSFLTRRRMARRSRTSGG
jgi:hypothetical protein